MTDDVAATCDWLLAAGFAVSMEQFGSMHSGLVRFDRPDVAVSVISERGQWMIDLETGGEKYDLDAVIAARAVRTERPPHRTRSLPRQLPEGVVWREEVPASIDWILSTRTATEQVRAAQRQRSKRLFGSDGSR
ncbi:MAG: hypothetical protein GY925_15475 [Actinomycetia bacterium]|nr:hypothetical protein [Actinomycetes bacterium]